MKLLTFLCAATSLLAALVTSSDNDVIMAERSTATDPVVANLTHTATTLLNTVNQLNAKLAAANTDLSNKLVQINMLNAQVSTQSQAIKNLTLLVDHGTASVVALNTFCHNSVNTLNGRVGLLEHPIAFTARFSNDSVERQSVNVGGHWQRLVFDTVLYQTGGSNYNSTTGIFTAPSDGTYAVFLTLQRDDPYQDDCLSATVMRGRSYLATATACPPGYSAASNMAVAWMRHGDQAFVRTQHSDRVFGYVHTTFSIMKIGSK